MRMKIIKIIKICKVPEYWQSTFILIISLDSHNSVRKTLLFSSAEKKMDNQKGSVTCL